MENKAHAFAAGAFVLVLLAALIALGVWFTRDTTVRNTYQLSTREPVSGLQPQATVRYRGIEVGKVTSIDFDPRTRGNVRVRLTVDARVPLTTSTYATLSYQGVTGLAFIALDDNGESAVPLKPDNAHPPRIPLKPSALAMLQERGEHILDQVQELAGRLNALVGPDNQQRVTTTLDNMAQLSETINRIAQKLDPALDHLSTLAGNAQRTLNSTKTAANKVSASADVLSKTVGNFDNATLPRLNRLTDDSGRVARNFNRFTKRLDDNPQILLFGAGESAPGPGEPGFVAPGAAKGKGAQK
ncbi:MAG: MlaD family protein [Burkholderiaceae bacterium]|jgi:phospholipid/cholesterol/gamma-HCH transport system substrate-binding protein|nr:MlaD family protein [Burkholderiaceae bacterium]